MHCSPAPPVPAPAMHSPPRCSPRSSPSLKRGKLCRCQLGLRSSRFGVESIEKKRDLHEKLARAFSNPIHVVHDRNNFLPDLTHAPRFGCIKNLRDTSIGQKAVSIPQSNVLRNAWDLFKNLTDVFNFWISEHIPQISVTLPSENGHNFPSEGSNFSIPKSLLRLVSHKRVF